MKQAIFTFMAFFIVLGCLGANYHASGVTSGVYLRPVDPSDGIYKGLYEPQAGFFKRWQDCERTLVIQNLTILKLKMDAQEAKMSQVIEFYNKMRGEVDGLLGIDPNDINDPNEER